MARETMSTALGREHRHDAGAPVTGGPAGNARLTAWTGLVLLVVFLAELVTLLDVRGLVSWHLAIGALLVPPAALKIATTGWRILRYYARSGPYVASGPPPMLLRLLGPLVIIGTVAVLGTGVLLVFLGPGSSRSSLLTVLGQRIDLLTLHQASFVAWAVATGLHAIARLVPALQLTSMVRGSAASAVSVRRVVQGRRLRVAALLLTVLASVLGAVLVLQVADGQGWSQDRGAQDGGPER